jgi:hypothetical protein
MGHAMRKGNGPEEEKGWAAVQERGRKLDCWVGLPSPFSLLLFFSFSRQLNSI